MSEDTLRDELTETLIEALRSHDQSWGGIDYPSLADALLPTVRREIDQARADEREAIAAELDRMPDELYPLDVFGGPWDEATAKQANELLRDAGLPVYDRVGAQAMRHAYRGAAHMVREGGDPHA